MLTAVGVSIKVELPVLLITLVELFQRLLKHCLLMVEEDLLGLALQVESLHIGVCKGSSGSDHEVSNVF